MKAFVRFVLVILCLFANVSYALDRTGTGFYYPIGTANFDSKCGTWLGRDSANGGCYFDEIYHVGVDMMTEGTDANVYAIADGNVIYISDDVKSWGAGNCALVIQHKKQDGSDFMAVYGHLACSTIPSLNSNVLAGHSIGKTGHYSTGIHLHFAIHDGSWSTMAKSGWGKMPNSAWPSTNTLTDPIAFIEGNKSVSSTCLGTLCGDAVVYHGKLRAAQTVRFGTEMISVTDVGWFPFVDRCVDAQQYFYMTKLNPASPKFNAVPAPSSICADVVPACFAQ